MFVVVNGCGVCKIDGLDALASMIVGRWEDEARETWRKTNECGWRTTALQENVMLLKLG